VKITINAGALADAIALTPKASKKTKPLAHITGDRGGIAIAISDSNITIAAKVPANVIELGETCVDAEALADLVKAFHPAAMLELQAGAIKDGLAITCGKSRFKLPMAPKPFEELAVLGHVTGYDIAGDDMLTLLSVLPAADDGPRDYLNGVCLHSDGGKVFGVATNGTVLLRTAVAGIIEGEAVIPAASVVTMVKLLKRVKPDTVRLRRCKRMFAMSCDRFAIVTRLIGTKFPDYQCVLPKGGTAASADIQRDDLALALRRLAAVAADCAATPLTALAWNADKSALDIFLVREPETGADIIEADAKGEPTIIVVALPALAGLINELGADRLHLEKTGTGALLVKAGDKLAVLSACKWKTEVAATAA
jgi:DNA polymerase-3 subunit beta